MCWNVECGQGKLPVWGSKKVYGRCVGVLQVLVCKGQAKERCCVPQYLSCQQWHVAFMPMDSDTSQPLPRVLESRWECRGALPVLGLDAVLPGPREYGVSDCPQAFCMTIYPLEIMRAISGVPSSSQEAAWLSLPVPQFRSYSWCSWALALPRQCPLARSRLSFTFSFWFHRALKRDCGLTAYLWLNYI